MSTFKKVSKYLNKDAFDVIASFLKEDLLSIQNNVKDNNHKNVNDTEF